MLGISASWTLKSGINVRLTKRVETFRKLFWANLLFVHQYPFCQLVYVCARVWKCNRKTAGNIIVTFPFDVQFFSITASLVQSTFGHLRASPDSTWAKARKNRRTSFYVGYRYVCVCVFIALSLQVFWRWRVLKFLNVNVAILTCK